MKTVWPLIVQLKIFFPGEKKKKKKKNKTGLDLDLRA